ncbi:hypothetical protein V1498_17570 [Peribacillus sp. SCS-26]|uniref:hypothetical protein n=1 Tax=Paraperibacillus marinus TaxID=3115295 RepID=UPI003906871D
MITIRVEYPIVKEDTVQFQYQLSGQMPVINKNGFYFKYPEMLLDDLPTEVFWNMFLALMVPVFNGKEDVLILFPEAVPTPIVEQWINFHNAGRVYVYPMKDQQKSEYLPVVESEPKVGILYGGGKDSAYAFSLLSELYGADNLLLISYVHPSNERKIPDTQMRRDKFILEPLRNKFNIKTQTIITDFRSSLTKACSYRVHSAIYTGSILPVLLKQNVNLLTHSNEFIQYWTGRFVNREEIKPSFHFLRSRPEYDNYTAKKYNAFFHTNLQIKNFNYYLSDFASFLILAKRYPDMLDHLLMCETTNPQTKWCYNCPKCLEFALFSMAVGHPPKGFDMERLFTGKYIQRIIKETTGLKPVSRENGNYPWVSCILGHFQTFCHAMATVNPDIVKKYVSHEGYNNFLILKQRYGNKSYPIHECLIEPALEHVSLPDSERIKNIVALYCPIVSQLPPYLIWGNVRITIDYKLEIKVQCKFNPKKAEQFLKQIDPPLNNKFDPKETEPFLDQLQTVLNKWWEKIRGKYDWE